MKGRGITSRLLFFMCGFRYNEDVQQGQYNIIKKHNKKKPSKTAGKYNDFRFQTLILLPTPAPPPPLPPYRLIPDPTLQAWSQTSCYVIQHTTAKWCSNTMFKCGRCADKMDRLICTALQGRRREKKTHLVFIFSNSFVFAAASETVFIDFFSSSSSSSSIQGLSISGCVWPVLSAIFRRSRGWG